MGTCPPARAPQNCGSSAERNPCAQCYSSCKRQPTRLRGSTCRRLGLLSSTSEEPVNLRPLWGLLGGLAPTTSTSPAVPHCAPEVQSFLQLCIVWLPCVKYLLLAGSCARFLGLPSTANHSLSQLFPLIKPTDERKRVLGWFLLLAAMLQCWGCTYRIAREVAHAEHQACQVSFRAEMP